MWKLSLNHANFFSEQQTVGEMSDHKLLLPVLNGGGGGEGAAIIMS